MRDRDRITSSCPPTIEAREIVRGADLRGRRAIVTGAASGIGLEIARALASAGAEVVVAARNAEAGRSAAEDINRTAGAGCAVPDLIDLGSLDSVRGFARRWASEPLHFLINNAGVMACPQAYTVDGFETHMGVNHLGHFLLSNLLLPALKRGAPSRVVALSSAGHRRSDIRFEDINYRNRPYDAVEAYGQSKTANALFAVEFDRRLGEEGVHAFAVDPGGVATALIRHMTDDLYARMGVVPVDRRPPGSLKTPAQGAATAVWAAVAQELEGKGGLYLQDCAEAPLLGPAHPRGVAHFAVDPAGAERLWSISEAETGL